MTEVVFARPSVLDGYPGHGKPCNRCGACCRLSLCVIAKVTFGYDLQEPAPGSCPALQKNAVGEAECGMMVNPARYAPLRAAIYSEGTMIAAAKFILGVEGMVSGCDLRIHGEPVDIDYIARRGRAEAELVHSVDAAGFVWGLSRYPEDQQ